MTVVAVLVDPPREGVVPERLSGRTPLSTDAALDLYEAAVQDTLRAVAGSGGDLLVNYRTEETIPESHRAAGGTPEETIREMVSEALDGDDSPRFEPQVGSTFSARAGNTVTHLLREEEATSVAVLRGTTPLLERTHVDSGAMKLRRSETVLGPSSGGSVHYVGFADTLEFDDVFDEPALEGLTERAVEAGHDVDFLPMLPTVTTPDGLATTVSTIRARARAERIVPEFTAARIDDLGLHVENTDGTASLVLD